MLITRAVTLALAASVASAALATAQDQPQCRNLSYRSNFRLNGAQQHLTRAQQTNRPEERESRLERVFRLLREAVQRDPGADQVTLWHFFAQAYALQGDLVGADSAWTRAEAATDEECRAAIQRERSNLWVPIVQEGTSLMSRERYDSAIVVFRRANVIFREDPAAYVNMASAFLSLENNDSAIAYFRLASRAGANERRADIRASAGFNAAQLARRANRLPLAESLYRYYLRLRPDDVDGHASLAAVLSGMGRNDEANRLYDSLLGHTDSMTSFQAFDLGVALFRGQRPAEAARAFESGLRKNPYHRDGAFNLVNAYMSAEDTARTLRAARQLVAMDPNNRQALRLLAGAYQRIGMGLDAQGRAAVESRDTATVRRVRPLLLAYQDSTLRALAAHDSLEWELNVARFDTRDSTAQIQGQVRNLQQREKTGFALVLEFVNGAGEVVSTERVDIPTLGNAGNPGSAYDFNLVASGRGILAYRYRSQ